MVRPLSRWVKFQQFARYTLLYPCFYLVEILWRNSIGRYVYVKTSRVAFAEAANMRHVRRNTTIPVPRPLFSIKIPAIVFWWRRGWYWGINHPYPDDTYLFMQRVQGKPLDHLLWLSYSKETQDAIIHQLSMFITQLRRLPLPTPAPRIGSVLGSSVSDYRLAEAGDPLRGYDMGGPYANEEAMNRTLRHGRSLDAEDLLPCIVESHTITHALVFTHGDLAMRNVMVDEAGTGLIAAFIDWESSGWFPAHWEYIKAVWVKTRLRGDEDFEARLPEVLETFTLEKHADDELVRLCYGED